jgi:transposase
MIIFVKKMNHIRIKNADKLASAIEDQLDGDANYRLFKKLYTILLVARHPHNNCSEVARLLSLSPHTVARWLGRIYTKSGFDLTRLNDKSKPGRPKRLDENQMYIIKDALANPPLQKGFQSTKWTGNILSEYIKREFHIDIQIRQCQKLMIKLNVQKNTKKSK